MIALIFMNYMFVESHIKYDSRDSPRDSELRALAASFIGAPRLPILKSASIQLSLHGPVREESAEVV
jgi:hypothetical protein